MKNICIVIDGLNIGGIEKLLLVYDRIINELGHDVTYVNLNPSKDFLQNQLSGSYKSYRYSIFESPFTYFYGNKKYRYWFFFLPFIFVFLSAYNGIRSFLFREFHHLTSRKKKYDLLISFSGHFNDLSFSYFNYVRAKVKIAYLHGSLTDYTVISEGFLRLYFMFQRLVSTSKFNNEYFYKVNKFFKKIPVDYIPLTLNPDYEYDKNKIDDLKKKYGDFFLFIARFTMEKDHLTVLRAYKILLLEGLENKLVFVGAGETFPLVNKLVDEMDLKNNVFFEGEVIDVHNYYKSAKLFIHSSLSENGPLTIIESMAHGLPVITSNSLPGVPEITNNGKYALVYNIGDEVALADCVNNLLSDQERYIALKLNGIERAKKYSMETTKVKIKKMLSDAFLLTEEK